MGLLKDLTGSFTAGLTLLAAITAAMLVPTALLRETGGRTHPSSA